MSEPSLSTKSVPVTRALVSEAMRALDGGSEVDLYQGPLEAIPREELLRRTRRQGRIVHVGSTSTTLSAGVHRPWRPGHQHP